MKTKLLIIGAICLLLAGCTPPDSSYEASLAILKKYPGADIIQMEGFSGGFWVRTKDNALLCIYFSSRHGFALDERPIFQARKTP